MREEERARLHARRRELVVRCALQWRSFTFERRLARLANAHHLVNRARRAVQKWRSRCTKRVEVWRADIVLESQVHYHKRRVAYKRWKAWARGAAVESTKRKNCEAVFVHFLMRRTFRGWREAAAEESVRKRQHYAALRFWMLSSLGKAWDGWQQSLQVSRLDQEKFRAASRFSLVLVKKHYFLRWRRFAPVERALRDRSQPLGHFLDKRMCGEALRRWRAAVAEIGAEEVLLERAAAHHARRCIRFGWQALRHNVAAGRALIVRRECDMHLVERCFGKMRTLVAQGVVLRQVQKTCHVRLLGSCFGAWRTQLGAVQAGHSLESQAAMMHRKQVLCVAVQSWRLNSHARRERRRLGDLGDSCADVTRLRRGLAQLVAAQDVRRLTTELSREAGTMRKWLAVRRWRQFTFHGLQDWRGERAAVRHRYFVQVTTCFKAWRACVRGSKLEEGERNQRCQLFWARTRARHFLAWLHTARWVQSHRREDQRLLGMAQAHRAIVVQRVMFLQWDAEAYQRRRRREETQERVAGAAERLGSARIGRLLRAWRALREDRVCERAASDRAEELYAMRLASVCWQGWRIAVVRGKAQRALERRANQFRSQTAYSAVFNAWRGLLGERRLGLHKQVFALRHWSLGLSKQVWQAWIAYVAIRRKKKARQMRVFAMRERDLLRTGVVQWLQAATDLGARRFEAAKEVQATRVKHTLDLVRRIGLHWRRKTLARMSFTPAPRPLLPATFSLRRRAIPMLKPALPATLPLAGTLPPRPSRPSQQSLLRGAPRAVPPTSSALLLELEELSRPHVRAPPRRPARFLLENFVTDSKAPSAIPQLTQATPTPPRAFVPASANPATSIALVIEQEQEPLQQLQEQLLSLAASRRSHASECNRLQKCQAKVAELVTLTTRLMQAGMLGPELERAECELQTAIEEALALQNSVRENEKVQAEEANRMSDAAARMHQLLHKARPRVPAEG